MANKIYQNDETALQWLASGGDELLTLTSVAAGAGRQGALHDFTAAARAREFAWRAYVQFATPPVVDEIIEIYWKSSDGTNPDNDDGTGDIAVSAADKLKNLQFLGVIIVDEAASAPTFVGSGNLDVVHQHGCPVFWNATADALSATAADHGFTLTPTPLEVQ